MKRILITGCAGAAATNFIKCINRNGPRDYYLVGTDMNEIQLNISLVDKKVLAPWCTEESYIDFLNNVAQEHQIDLIYPQTDFEMEVISNNREKIKYPVFLPNKKSVTICRNKFMSYQSFREAGVPVAETKLISNIQELEEAFSYMSGKYSKMWFRAVKGAGSRAAIPINQLDIAREWMNFWNQSNRLEINQFLLQEYLPNKDYAFQSVWFEGKLICSFARQRLQYMFGSLSPSNQSSSASVAISVHDDRINDAATKAILAVDKEPHGVYCVDLKEDEKNIPNICEINIGRFFTTCDFAMQAGCNMPEIFLNLYFGKSIPKVKQYNSIDKDLLWIRNVDREPKLVKKEALKWKLSA